MTSLRIVCVATALYVLASGLTTAAQSGRGEHWVGTWGTAVVPRPQPAPGAAPGRGAVPLNFNNQTLRQIVHVSRGGNRVRVVLSNAFGTLPLAIGGASVALRQKESAAVAGSIRPLTFSGGPATMVPAGATVISDTHGIKVVAGTLLPFEGTNLGAIAQGYYSAEKDARRREINELIRSSKVYDGVIDFEAALRDPGHPLQLLARFKGADNLHLTDAGYEAMANAVNLALLRR